MTYKTASDCASRRPEWSVVTYDGIEEVRKELKMPKIALARALGITNSTYHNWARGVSVPHPHQQQSVKSTLTRLKDRVAGGASASDLDPRPRASGTAPAPSGNVGGGSHQMQRDYARLQSMLPVTANTVPGIATIAAAWISTHDAPPSAGSIAQFIKDLRDDLESSGT